MEKQQTKSINQAEESGQSSVSGFFTLFRDIKKQDDIDRLISMHNSLIPRVFRICLIFGIVLFVVGSALFIYQEISKAIPEENPVLNQINISDEGGISTVLTNVDSSFSKAIRYESGSDTWDVIDLIRDEVFSDWISISPSSGEMIKMTTNEFGDVTFSYYDENANDWREVYKFDDGISRQSRINGASIRVSYDFHFDWETRFGFYGLTNFGNSQKERFEYKEDTLFHRYSKFTIDTKGQMDVSDFNELDEITPNQIVDGWVLGKNQSNEFWKYSIQNNVSTKIIGISDNGQFRDVSTPYSVFSFNNGPLVIRHKNPQDNNRPIIDLPVLDNYKVQSVNEDSSGNVLMATNSQIFHSNGDLRSWIDVPLPSDSLIIKSMAFDWKTETGAMIVFSNGFDQIYVCSGDVNTWRHVPLIIASFGLPFQNIEWIIGLLGLLDISMLILLFVKGKRIRKKVAEKTNESIETPLSLRSDNPVEEDTLGIFTSSKNALAKLIANESTQPPVSIAINGGWGSGKSSLMKMLRKDLKDNGNYVTIWFNVWHFESEEHLLTVFLSKMVEKFNSDLGIAFRMRLFVNRIRRLSFNSKFRFFFFIFMITPLVLYFLNSLLLGQTSLDLNGIKSLNQLFEGIKAFIVQGTNIENWRSSLWLPVTGGLFLVAILTGIFNIFKAWAPTGLSALMQLFPIEELKKEAHEKNPGYRDKYKKEFWRLLESVGKNTKIVVFVDDLDRVTGSKIKQLLEGINFISDTASKPDDVDNDTANMYFIVGMALKEVVKNLEAELIKDKKFTTEGEKVSLGLRFIEKMIDLTVQIPPISRASEKNLQSLVSMENGK